MLQRRRNRPGPAARGYDRDWFRARARHLRDNPYCLMCLKQGQWVLAEHVDHNETIRARPDLRLEPSNFYSLCARHHNLLTARYDEGDLRGACGIDGLPLVGDHPWSQNNIADAIAVVNRPFAKQPSPPGLAARLKRRAITGK